MSINPQELIDAWPSGLVARKQVGEFSGGAVAAQTLANLAARNEGPPPIWIGRRVCYETRALAEWIATRAKREAPPNKRRK